MIKRPITRDYYLIRYKLYDIRNVHDEEISEIPTKDKAIEITKRLLEDYAEDIVDISMTQVKCDFDRKHGGAIASLYTYEGPAKYLVAYFSITNGDNTIWIHCATNDRKDAKTMCQLYRDIEPNYRVLVYERKGDKYEKMRL